MEKIKSFFENLDNKVSPKFGKIFYFIFKIITLVMIFIGIPAIAFGFGMAQLNGSINPIAIHAVFWPFLIILIISSLF